MAGKSAPKSKSSKPGARPAGKHQAGQRPWRRIVETQKYSKGS